MATSLNTDDVLVIQHLVSELILMVDVLPLLAGDDKAISQTSNYVGLLIFELSEKFDSSLAPLVGGA